MASPSAQSKSDRFSLRIEVRYSTGGSSQDSTNTSTTRSSNTAVARYDGAIVANGVGSATISADTLQRYFRDYACSQSYPLTASSSLTNNPSVSSITPPRGLIGNTIQIAINGDGFGATPVVNVPANGGITVSNVSAGSGGTLVNATFAIAVDAVGGNKAISVTAGGKTSNSQNFFVQIPSRLVPFDVSGATNGVGPLQTPVNDVITALNGTVLFNGLQVCGVYRNYAFILVDQNGERILQPFTLGEVFSNYQSPAGFPAPTFEPASIAAGEFVGDIQTLAFPGFQCLVPNDTQSFTQKFYVEVGQGQSKKRFDPSTTIRIEKGNFAGTLRVDRTITTP
ncbi:MAG: hypothetical protein MSG64_15980 [Pyrinomonadaceae bacterium MAG19_C2-C3]|nr:hypothetical protein [Pyrinomonadaceae bacterium MAG19_C2-C3]